MTDPDSILVVVMTLFAIIHTISPSSLMPPLQSNKHVDRAMTIAGWVLVAIAWAYLLIIK